MDESRRRGLAGELARRGFLDSARSAGTLLSMGADLDDEGRECFLAATSTAADPDLALARLAELDAATLAELADNPRWLSRVTAVMGGSRPLGRHLVLHREALASLHEAGADATEPVEAASEATTEAATANEAAATAGATTTETVDESIPSVEANRLRAKLWDAVLAAVPQGPADGHPAVLIDPQGAGADALRVANRSELAGIAARDLSAADPAAVLPSITAELSDLADAVVDVALALARGQVPGAERVRLAVIALGKCGARELNYLSDVDVLFVAEPVDVSTTQAEAVQLGTKIAAALMRLTSANTAAGSIWTMDAGLRPEGNAGPLVRTLDAMAAYYAGPTVGPAGQSGQSGQGGQGGKQVTGGNAAIWEFQAMMKARPMAGDMALGQAFCNLVLPLVWMAGGREGFVTESRAMRRRVVSLIPRGEADREIKLGAGGLRDVEFSVQILQLVHGRNDEALRQPATLAALAALSQHNYISEEDAAELADAYRFERLLEHRQQLFRLRRTHLMPDDPVDLRRLARSMRGAGESGEALWTTWRRTANRVQRLQRRVFYSPLLEAVAKVPSGALRLSSDAAEERLTALGFVDPAAALRHIAALTQGVSRAAEITRHLMPAMLGWLADGANPDAGLLAFRQVSEALGQSHWYLKTLRDESGMAERLARVIASSRFAVDLLRRDPPSVALLRQPPSVAGSRQPSGGAGLWEDTGELTPRAPGDLNATFIATVRRHADVLEAAQALRAVRRHELARLAVAVVLGYLHVEALGAALSDVTAATLEAGLVLAARAFPAAPPLGVVAMGRWGGRELSFASDADALFVAPDGVGEQSLAAAAEAITALRGWLRLPGPDPALEIDVRLRPEGKDGPLVRTVSSYLSYYGRWSWTWEAQSLVRASHGAGDEGLTAALLDGIAPLRWPTGGLGDEDVHAIRLLKVRLDREYGSNRPNINLKHGPGGLVDIEWTVQLLQLSHAGVVPSLRVTGTLAALRAATEAGLMTAGDAKVLSEAWQLVSRVRDAIVLTRGRAADTLPSDARDVAAVAVLLGYGKAEASALWADLAKAMRRASRVAERLFWGRR